jgi:hypothetical protein
MNLLICSFEFDSGAEGICTGRLIRALLNAGCQITLATSNTADLSFQHEHLEYAVFSTPRLPFRVLSLLARLHRAPRSNVFWCRRVARMQPPKIRPDLVYGRAMPISSVEAARLLAAKLRLPLWAHLSDPFPEPWEDARTNRFARMLYYAHKLVRDTQALTFTTAQGLAFQERSVKTSLSTKAFVLNHVAPEPSVLPPPPDAKPTFAYIGSFYGKRTPDALLEGFAQHLKSSRGSSFLFVGTDPTSIAPQAARLGIVDSLRVIPRVKNILPHLATAHALVTVDAAQDEPVFLPTKIIEYLVVDRPVLVISPAKSPAAALAKRFQRSVLHVPPDQPQAIADGLTQTLHLKPDPQDYSDRFQQMQEFTGPTVAARFLEEAAARGVSSHWTRNKK